MLFLAGIGTRAGETFGATIADSRAIVILSTGMRSSRRRRSAWRSSSGCASCASRRPTLAGVIAGIQTQPAVLAFAGERTSDEREVNLGYASVYPLAVIAKIVVAQVMLRILMR